tara:strand:+ start:2087 stop:2410 length:324 start_codon:yes stop_codon:yes gene_type:complete
MSEDLKANGIDTKFIISLLVGLAIQAGGIVWWASKMQSSVQHNDFQIQMIAKDVAKNSEFVELWPAGKWGSGSLPSDVRQDLKIGMLEIDMDKVMSKLYNGTHPIDQ